MKIKSPYLLRLVMQSSGHASNRHYSPLLFRRATATIYPWVIRCRTIVSALMPMSQWSICGRHLQVSKVKGQGRPRFFFSLDDRGINGHNGFSVSYSGRMMQLSAIKQAAHTHSQCGSVTTINKWKRELKPLSDSGRKEPQTWHFNCP